MTDVQLDVTCSGNHRDLMSGDYIQMTRRKIAKLQKLISTRERHRVQEDMKRMAAQQPQRQ